ncbi:MAG: RIP metalloprotease RseP, partial [Rubricella sp.]
AGPFANFILSIVVFAGIASWTGVARDVPVIGPVPPSVAAETPLREGDRILSVDGEAVETFVALREAFGGIDAGAEAVVLLEREGARLSVDLPYPNPPFVVGVRPLSSASRAGIEPGDLIVGVDGVRIGTISALQDYVELREGQDVTVTIRRGDALLDLTMEPRVEDVQEPDGSFDRRAIIGVTVSGYLAPQTEFPGVLSALRIGVERTYGVIATSLNGLYHIIVGDIGAENIQGPVGIAQISGETASRGFVDLILLVGILSTAIGMMNLFPIPVLDGGHLLFNAWEAVTGHPPSGRALDIAMGLGLASILSLMVFATYNDLARLLSFWA